CAQLHQWLTRPFTAKGFDAVRPHQRRVLIEWHVRVRIGVERRWTIENLRVNSLRRGSGKAERGAHAPRPAKQRDSRQAEMLAECRQVLDVPVRMRNARGETVAAAIEAYQAKRVTQRPDLGIPHLQIQGPSMHQEHRRAATFVAIAQAYAVND